MLDADGRGAFTVLARNGADRVVGSPSGHVYVRGRHNGHLYEAELKYSGKKASMEYNAGPPVRSLEMGLL